MNDRTLGDRAVTGVGIVAAGDVDVASAGARDLKRSQGGLAHAPGRPLAPGRVPPGGFPPAVEDREQPFECPRTGRVHALAAAASSAGTISCRLRSRAASRIAAAAHEPAHRVPRVWSGLRARAPRQRWSSRAGPAAAPGGRSGPPRISAVWAGYSRIVSAARQSHGPAARPSARRRWRPC